jgi:outer membrane protein OmpA-like peptidoglycan-associated protein
MPNTAIMTSTLRSALRAAAVVALCGAFVAWAPSRANADSGRLNLHVDLGAGIPIMGYLAPPGNNDLTARLGIGGWLSLDYVVAGPVALEVIGSAGYLLEMADGAPRDPSGDLALGRFGGSMMWMAGAGVRIRLIDPQDGYANEENGDIAGGFWVSAHVGVHQFDGIQIGLDGALGYDLSIARPFSMGFFVRGYLLFAGDGKPQSVIERTSDNHTDAALFAGLSFSFELLARDRVEAEPEPEPEPELVPTETDRDGDGIDDVDDQCPDDPEDRDNFQDEDGCPDPDNDNDRVLDVEDRCPMDAEDLDGFEDVDGCPEADNDGDGVVDLEDRCPNEAGVIENRGCPDSDRDGDTVVDRRDNCPDEPGSVENHGCQEQQLVVLQDDRIEILDNVYFRTNSHRIERRSYPLLDNIASVLAAHPEIALLSIEGHTDSRGRPANNLRLSQRRARSVMDYLRRKGIDRARLQSEGYGQTRPVVPDAVSEEDLARNRRVEFNIVHQEE